MNFYNFQKKSHKQDNRDYHYHHLHKIKHIQSTIRSKVDLDKGTIRHYIPKRYRIVNKFTFYIRVFTGQI